MIDFWGSHISRNFSFKRSLDVIWRLDIIVKNIQDKP